MLNKLSFKLRIAKIISITFIVILLITIGFGLFLKTKYIPPVLMYHYVLDIKDTKKDKRIITPQTFERQMHFLKTKRYNVITLEELASFFREKKRLPKNTVVITFDDGHLDNYENAYPILKKYNFPAVMFIIVGDISKPNFVTEGQLREMSDSGLITIGSHTLSHAHLPSIVDEGELKKEIFDSKNKLEEILGKPVNCFSYPTGGFNKQVRDMLIKAGYTTAASTSPGLNYPNDDPYAIKRVKISESSKNLFIFWFEVSGLYKYLLELRKNNESSKSKKYEK